MNESAAAQETNSVDEAIADTIEVIEIHSEGSLKDKCNIELIKLEPGEEFEYTHDGVVALSDGIQWIPIAGVNICNESGDTENNTFIQLVEENCEGIEIPIEAEIGEDDKNTTQVVLLEDGRLAYMQPIYSDDCNEVANKDSKEVKEVKELENPKLNKKKRKNYLCPEPGCHRAYSSLHHLKLDEYGAGHRKLLNKCNKRDCRVVHSRNHTGDRPYQCNFEGCSKAFATDYSRKAHLRTHTGEAPYCCPFSNCLKKFKTSGDLQKHIRIHTGERPFVCTVKGCNRSFTTSNIRTVHMRTHTGEKPYVCSYDGCNRGFASSTNFKNHMRIHSGEKPYLCGVPNCSKRFTEYSSLYKHQLVHLQQKRHQCNFCSKTYRQPSTLTIHKRTNHGVISADDGTEIVLEEMVGFGETGHKKFKDIASKLLKLKRGETATIVTIEDEGTPVYIVPDVENVNSSDGIEESTEKESSLPE